MPDVDPDAMWQPGYAGPVVYGRTPSAPAAAPPPPTGRRRFVVAVGLVVTALAAGGWMVTQWTSPDGGAPAEGRSLPRVPADPRRRWSVTIDGQAERAVAGSADEVVAVVVAVGERQQVVALDAASGAERWRTDVSTRQIDSIALLGDVVVASSTPDAERVSTLVGLQADTGSPLWRRSVEGAGRAVLDGGHVIVARTAGESSDPALELLDPASGAVVSTIVGSDVSLTRWTVQRRDGDRIEVFDRATFQPLADIDAPALGFPGASGVGAAMTDAGVVVASGATVVLVDDDGLARSAVTLTAPAAGAARVDVDVLDDAGRYVAVQRGDRLAVLSTAGGELRELWSDSAWMLDWHVDAERRLVATATVSGSIVAMPPRIVDAATGEELWDGPAAVQLASPLRIFAGDGFIVVTDPAGAAADVVAYDLDRTELWRRPIRSGDDVALVDGGLVTIDRRTAAAATTITLDA